MRHLDLKHGSVEWIQARLGIPTASQFSRIITPKTLQPSGQAKAYIAEKVAEWAIDMPLNEYASAFMERGSTLEHEGTTWYELDRSFDSEDPEASGAAETFATRPGGFFLRDDGPNDPLRALVGCSPDRLVGDEGMVEIKCPGAKGHMLYLLEDGLLEDQHRCQVQGQLWLAGRAWCDLVSYHPTMPSLRRRMARDEAFIGALEAAVTVFVEEMLAARERYVKLGGQPPLRLEAQEGTHAA